MLFFKNQWQTGLVSRQYREDVAVFCIMLFRVKLCLLRRVVV
jgi:hypothetical protein